MSAQDSIPPMVDSREDSGSSSQSSNSAGSESSQVHLHGVSSAVQPQHQGLAAMAGAEQEYFCGAGKCRPKWMQVFRNSKFFTFILCLNCAIEGALVSGFVSVVLSSIERRYRFSSLVAGFIASSFDMAVLVSVLFISYFGGRGHKPKWLGISLIIQGSGAFIFSLPQFVVGPYEVNGTVEQEFCGLEAESPDCSPANYYILVLFFVGNILIGVGAAPLFTIGTSYLDDIVSPKFVTIHLGIFYAFSVIGPAIGYGLGGAFLSIYVDPWADTTLQPKDPGYVGAWWLCFVFAGTVSWLFAIPFLLFPRMPPNSSAVKAERLKEMAQKYEGVDSGLEEVDFATKVKSFPRHLKQVVKTPSWLFITIAIVFSTLVVSGVASFAPKYLESQFGLTASTASVVAGAVAIVSGGAGTIIGALIIYFTKSKGRNVALINWTVTLVALFPIMIFIVHCPTLELVGVKVEYPDGSLVSSPRSDLISSCISLCNCSSSRFDPICGEDGYTYFSPCAAGCPGQETTTQQPLFQNCSCIADRIMNNSLDYITNGSAVDGKCDQGCNKMGLFLGVLFVGLLLVFVLQVPNIVITVRCVADEQRTLALGTQSVLFRAFGSVPGPVVFGQIFDSACIYWQTECDRRGNCWVYDNTALSQRAVILAVLGIVANFIFSLLSWLFYPKPKPSPSTPLPESKLDISLSDLSDKPTQEANYRPSKRLSVHRMESSCSEDILLDSEM